MPVARRHRSRLHEEITKMKTWIFLSAHCDDAVLSAGGLVWELTRRGERAEIWTICAGDPPANPATWKVGRP